MMLYLFYIREYFKTLFTKRNVSIVILSAAGAANTKFLLIPIVVLILGLIVYRFIVLSFQQNREINLQYKRWLAILPATCLVTILILATPIKNTVLHGNPFYPVKVEIANVVLNYKEDLPTSIVPAKIFTVGSKNDVKG